MSTLLVACASFRDLGRDLEQLEGTVTVTGKVSVVDWNGKPVVVVAARVPKDRSVAISTRTLLRAGKPGAYRARLMPDRYWIAAFVDENGNQQLDDGERGALSQSLEIVAGRDQEVPPLTVRDVWTQRARAPDRAVRSTFQFAVGEVRPLQSDRFDGHSSAKGVWQPISFFRDEAAGLYFLEPYTPAKTPVLFVHGMSGYPQEFTRLIDRLDRARFQPWLFLYPSGYYLNDTSVFLMETLDRIVQEQRVERLCVVAHSMGGLVARSFLRNYEAKRPEHGVRSLVTIASPLGGMPSAAWGVKMAPEVVPAWIDLAPGSQFLRQLYDRPLSDRVEYHLLFAYDDSGSSDGVVPLLSQLRGEAQREALMLRGYRATHTGALRSDAVAAQVLRALERCGGRADLGLVAERPDEPSVVP